MPHATTSSPAARSATDRNSPTSGVLLVVNAGDRAYREYGLAQIAARHRAVLIGRSGPSWEVPYIADHEVADLDDLDDLLEAADDLALNGIRGVLTWDEFSLVGAAHIAERLGTPGNSTATAMACRDKAASRAAFDAANVPSAKSTPVTTLEEAERAADATGYPVVLKPARQAGSLGVIKAENPAALATAYAHAAQAAEDDEGTDVLVEEYLDGPEISVECVTVRGATTPVAITRKQLGAEPFFEETGHSVEAGDPLLALAGPVAVAALTALGFANGVSHVEMRLTSAGPRLIEVNGRLGGDLIPHLVREATGIDLPLAAADIALGLEPDLTPTLGRLHADDGNAHPTPRRRSNSPTLGGCDPEYGREIGQQGTKSAPRSIYSRTPHERAP
ncbi:acetyl-CoA carboxylase biotin carboxylase subunit family protein [Kitasatospora sp. NPDC057015]|uniref:ATP-grasp domain-containing protein n=1 Tax=Kitasatospora sp. NPDC057015 TaxID=3346001 RepID=UPI00364025E3